MTRYPRPDIRRVSSWQRASLPGNRMAMIAEIRRRRHLKQALREAEERFRVLLEQVESERISLMAQLQQAQKMESMGRLAGGVAHDFNNMLGVILGQTELAMGKLDPATPIYANLTEICKAVERSANLTRQLLSFARKQTVTPQILDLNKSVQGMIKMLSRLIGEDINLVWLPQAGVWPVKVDPTQIDQILANLCVNARDAINGVGKVIIETVNCVIDEDYCLAHPRQVPGEYVSLAIRDDGSGISEETMAKIFEPFFTTKEIGKGTGLGLATVYGIVQQNNGFIEVNSEPCQGTTFKINLPRHVGTRGQERTAGVSGPALRGHETILLVEDEVSILEMTTQMLVVLGYTVFAASTPSEAIRLARDHAPTSSLLMSDVVMPEMNGRALAKTLQSLYPHLKTLFTSGYTAEVINHNGTSVEGLHFIQKPFSLKDLATKVRGVLDSE